MNCRRNQKCFIDKGQEVKNHIFTIVTKNFIEPITPVLRFKTTVVKKCRQHRPFQVQP